MWLSEAKILNLSYLKCLRGVCYSEIHCMYITESTIIPLSYLLKIVYKNPDV